MSQFFYYSSVLNHTAKEPVQRKLNAYSPTLIFSIATICEHIFFWLFDDYEDLGHIHNTMPNLIQFNWYLCFDWGNRHLWLPRHIWNSTGRTKSESTRSGARISIKITCNFEDTRNSCRYRFLAGHNFCLQQCTDNLWPMYQIFPQKMTNFCKIM